MMTSKLSRRLMSIEHCCMMVTKYVDHLIEWSRKMIEKRLEER